MDELTKSFNRGMASSNIYYLAYCVQHLRANPEIRGGDLIYYMAHDMLERLQQFGLDSKIEKRLRQDITEILQDCSCNED